MRSRFIGFLLILYISTPVMALDLVGLIDTQCRVIQGLVINVSDERVDLLGQDGYIKNIDRKQVQAVLIYKGIQTPISKIVLNPELLAYSREIFIGGSSITGWPIQFIDNIVVVFDIQGKIHLIDINQILKIKKTTLKSMSSQLSGELQTLGFGDLPLNCNLKSTNKDILPSQSMIDIIRVQDFFTSLQNGFEQMRSFEERTNFYAKPILFDEHARFGITSGTFKDQFFSNFPLYFQWSRGEPYRFQSFTKMGGGQFPESPSFSNPFAFYSEVKSHLFHGVFLGNLAALSSGSEFYTKYSAIANSEIVREYHTTTSYNYMALMGADYNSWSFSFGTYYPIYGINIKTYFREILASNVSPLFRLKYTTSKFETSIVVSKTTRSISSGVNDDHMSMSSSSSVIGTIDSFNFDSNLIKGNFKIPISKNIQLGGSVILLDGKYSEILGSGIKNSVDFSNTSLSADVALSFGNYITLRAHGLNYISDRKFNISTLSENSNQTNSLEFGGSLEFIF